MTLQDPFQKALETRLQGRFAESEFAIDASATRAHHALRKLNVA
jgi:hypothetical protein